MNNNKKKRTVKDKEEIIRTDMAAANGNALTEDTATAETETKFSQAELEADTITDEAQLSENNGEESEENVSDEWDDDAKTSAPVKKWWNKTTKFIAAVVSGILAVGLIAGVAVGIIYGKSVKEMFYSVDSLQLIRDRANVKFYVPEIIKDNDGNPLDFKEGSLIFKKTLSDGEAAKETNNGLIKGFRIAFSDDTGVNGFLIQSDFTITEINAADLKGYTGLAKDGNGKTKTMPKIFICVNPNGDDQGTVIVTVHFMVSYQYFTVSGLSLNTETNIENAVSSLCRIADEYFPLALTYLASAA